MHQAGHDRHGHRLSALIVVLWCAGLRIHEALSLTETDLDGRRGSILVRHGLAEFGIGRVLGRRSAHRRGDQQPKPSGQNARLGITNASA
jgi:hypothetical protein